MIISANNLTKVYGDTTVLDIPELHLKEGESFGLVGNNGAGKTTLFRLFLDLIKPSTGEVIVDGKNVQHTEDWKNITGSFLDENYLIGHLRPDEYFEFIASMRGLTAGDLKEQLQPFEKMFKGEITAKNKYIRDLSKGNQKKVGVAGAMLGKPKLLILDEPFSNLDPSSQFELRTLLTHLDKNTDTTVVVSSHDLGHIAEFCDRIVILDRGKIARDIYADEHTLARLEEFFIEEIRNF